MMKKIVWIGTTKERLKKFPPLTQHLAGYQLQQVQFGRIPADWKPMPDVGTGVIEIRVHQPHEHRILYVANYPEAVYVIHAFAKKTAQTPHQDIITARRNYARIENERKTKIQK